MYNQQLDLKYNINDNWLQNDHSFLSDINLDDEFQVDYYQTNDFKNQLQQNQNDSEIQINYQQQIPQNHYNNFVQYHLVGTKRRKYEQENKNDSYNSSTKSSFQQNNTSNSNIQDESGSKLQKKRQQNKESALKSRLKKKQYYESIEIEFQNVQILNNKLKLDNAALRAENQILKRQLKYFENLFAKKAQSATNSLDKKSYKTTSDNNSQINDEENTFENQQIKKRVKDKGKNEDFSFVLERKSMDSNTSSAKIGVFTLALVMCVCSIQSFFLPLNNITNTNSNQVSNVGQQFDFGGMQLKQVENDQIQQQTLQQEAQSNAQYESQMNHLSFVFRIIFLIFFALTILTFPFDEIQQWAARKSYLRKIFNLQDVPLQTNKAIKNQ